MRTMHKLGLTAVLLFALSYAGTAAAIPVWYADVQTSTLLGNRHADLTTPLDPGGIDRILSNSELEWLGTGLGSGYVAAGSPLEITHSFEPNGVSADSVYYAAVTVGVMDDFDLEFEYGELRIGSDLLDSGNAFLNLFGGEVTALITTVGDAVTLSVSAVRGDFRVAFSALTVHFDGTTLTSPTPAIPEPSAALIFAVGLVVAGWRRRS